MNCMNFKMKYELYQIPISLRSKKGDTTCRMGVRRKGILLVGCDNLNLSTNRKGRDKYGMKVCV